LMVDRGGQECPPHTSTFHPPTAYTNAEREVPVDYCQSFLTLTTRARDDV
jgi:hypothetical protein